MLCDDHLRHRLFHPSNHRIAQARDPLLLLPHLGDRFLQRRRRCRGRGHVHRAGADPALLPAAQDHRFRRRRAPGQQDAGAARPAELVRTGRQRGRAELVEVHRNVPDRLHRVHVHRGARSVGAGDCLTHRLDRAGFVVRPHHRRHRGRGIQRGKVRDHAVSPHRQPRSLPQRLDHLEHRRVLDRGGHHAPAAGGAPKPAYPDVVRLGAGAGEHHLHRIRPQRGRDALACVGEHRVRLAPGGVLTAGVQDTCVLYPRVDGALAHGSGGCVIEVDHAPQVRRARARGTHAPPRRRRRERSPRPSACPRAA